MNYLTEETSTHNQSLVVAQPAAPQVAAINFTPEALMEQIQKKAQMRKIMTDYMRSEMVESHDYYSFKEGDKPTLTQEGAYKIINLFDGITGQPQIEKVLDAEGHLSVEVAIDVCNANGARIATGNGSASTRESKHASRWVYESDVPGHLNKETLEFKEWDKRGGGKFRKYRLPNSDLYDLHNTVLKMAVKRATVAAARKLPLVSDLFAPGDPDNGQKRTAQSAPRQQQAPAPKFSPKVTTALGLVKTLQEVHGVTDEELSAILPEGVDTFENLTDIAAVACTEDLKMLLRAKANAK